MRKDTTIEEISLSDIEIGQSQVRTDLSSGIDDLAASISKQGLLQPIFAARLTNGKYEILAGQRRFLACKKLGLTSIRAVVTDASKVDELERVAISLSENLVRKDNSQKELIDACTKLFKRYGSLKMVADETGLSASLVSQYVKYDQLVPSLKEKVDSAKIDMKVALQAQKAATSADGSVDEVAAEKFAAELSPLSNQQRRSFVKVATEDPTESLEEKIEKGRKQPVLKQVVITLEDSLHKALQKFAHDESINQDEAAVTLIEDGLSRRQIEVD
jgi:ParB family chromosome partitioning protein